MKILVAYDGSECADAALDDLRRAGLPADSRVKVLSVLESWMPPPSGLEIVEHVDGDQEYLSLARRAGLRLVSMESVWDVETETGAGSPATVIIKRADEWDADLIVVGSHGRSALGRFFFGSVSQKVLRESGRSVRVARGRIEEPGAPVRLVIGVDGSEGADAAVEAAAARKWPAGSEARIVSATWAAPQVTSQRMVGPITNWILEEKARVQKMIDKDIDKLTLAGLKTDAIVKDGDPKSLLITEAESWGADCVFVGARGLGRVERFMLGSVSSAVAARAHCSVEVVHNNIERTNA
ncbi:MAG TPA: universal stress protein [Blastocatellia bacterium]|jgi:nucleotide-binding universal stress UspA family protein|nr:universal stress protein [Blastocatellia bacterium]